MAMPDAFLRGRLVDENGLPPLSASFSVLTEGNSRGHQGFVRVQGDHKFHRDGTFTSPPLMPGRYFLRFFGVLQGSSASANDKQRRVFDFIYPNADTVSEGLPFDLKVGETMESAFSVPAPTWFKIAGCIKGTLPTGDHKNLSILFRRNMEILPDVGTLGLPVRVNGSFEGLLLRGSYEASLHEMTEPEPSGYTRSLRRFGTAKVMIERDNLNLELPIQ